MSDCNVRVRQLFVHPVKSCAGLARSTVALATTGFTFDRQWMVVDADGVFVTQRELPRMALVATDVSDDGVLTLSAPGVAPLVVGADAGQRARRVEVWDHTMPAHDCGDGAARWLSVVLGVPLRLVRFDDRQRRLSNRRWTGGIEALNAFSDGYPILVVSQASLDALNDRLAAKGRAPVAIQRFRPNLVLDGLDANEEDHLGELRFTTPAGPVVLRLVKPCPRCPIPNIDPTDASVGDEPGATLLEYRRDARVDGAVTFGMNAVIVEGVGRTLAVGAAGEGRFAFD